jgi:hypothetical protein
VKKRFTEEQIITFLGGSVLDAHQQLDGSQECAMGAINVYQRQVA